MHAERNGGVPDASGARFASSAERPPDELPAVRPAVAVQPTAVPVAVQPTALPVAAQPTALPVAAPAAPAAAPAREAPAREAPAAVNPNSEESNQLFARWEKEGLEGYPEAEPTDPTDEEANVLVRTPEQHARRLTLIRFVAGLLGFLIVIVAFVVWRSVMKIQAPYETNAAEPSATAKVEGPKAPPSALAATDTSAAPMPTASSGKFVSPAASVQALPAARRIAGLDLEVPPGADPSMDQVWDGVEQAIASGDFKTADKAIADLGKTSDPVTKETARLARALWWINNGKSADVKPVIADLAANATTSYVRKRARDLLQQ
jgi:hypothetical protein